MSINLDAIKNSAQEAFIAVGSAISNLFNTIREKVSNVAQSIFCCFSSKNEEPSSDLGSRNAAIIKVTPAVEDNTPEAPVTPAVEGNTPEAPATPAVEDKTPETPATPAVEDTEIIPEDSERAESIEDFEAPVVNTAAKSNSVAKWSLRALFLGIAAATTYNNFYGFNSMFDGENNGNVPHSSNDTDSSGSNSTQYINSNTTQYINHNTTQKFSNHTVSGNYTSNVNYYI
ncbi:MAG: hypothetical protein CMO81_11670 [Waddliaceae bacterium]|nr:hypothetical protein [Waddliaceae bacterium]